MQNREKKLAIALGAAVGLMAVWNIVGPWFFGPIEEQEAQLALVESELDKLEDQMVEFTPDFDRKVQGYSPDRVDALVWAYTELFPSIVHRVEDESEDWDDWDERGRSSVGGY